jgi:hypothetical protein
MSQRHSTLREVLLRSEPGGEYGTTQKQAAELLGTPGVGGIRL